MAEDGESSKQGSPFNITTLIALLTLAGGILLVSKKLASDRPITSSERSEISAEDQSVAARLWEDPCKWKTNESQANGHDAFELLRMQIAAHTDEFKPAILAVMVQGGTYSEDVESRIRSRFAIVSALGECHDVPESADHLGAVLVPWPSAADIRGGWLTNAGSIFSLAGEEEGDASGNRAAN